ncbi:alpha-galactosidase [Companilactobacillus sp. HBUAS56275]|uniref:Alpha-galactosidase n=1 Tax=Candidatus Companilactobacillus pullicola TaxID=2838523 RepID=A0A9D1ZPG7_9LACO|nr:alpha-galactosidase [Candidatus Companilactobacillus pullicola]
MNTLIQVDTDKKIFYLCNKEISYIFRVLPKTQKLEHIYFGRHVASHGTVKNVTQADKAWGEDLIAGNQYSSLSRLMQEYPEYGTGDYRLPAFEINYPDGDEISNFEYANYKIIDGVPDIKGMPHVRYSKSDCQTLIVTLKDQYSGLKMKLNYTIDSINASLIRNVEVVNDGEQIYTVKSLKSMALDVPNDDYDLITLNGIWAREKQVNRESINPGIKEISSRRGASGHVHDPFVALVSSETTQNSGEVYGISTIYSGNHKETVELDAYDVVRVTAGINDDHFSWDLNPGENFVTPQTILVFSDRGFNKMSQTFHNLVRNHLIAPRWRKRKNPVLINNWEATYFDFNEKKILDLAKKASQVGCNLFVLDDGWFAERNSEKGSLGDWRVNYKKLPHGLDGLSSRIHKLGMDFGLWFEPESVSEDTPIFKQHPDWIIGIKNKSHSQGRNQYLLDFSNPAVVDNIYKQMDKILSTTKIDYIKWDMNRNITEPYSQYLSLNQQGEFYHRYILGVYSLYERLVKKYPEILFESCASGGGRFDLGMLYYAPQTWGSDDTDAYERWEIQKGESYVYPLSTIGTHVSASPNHQTGRQTPLKTRGNIALFGTFGYELDLLNLSELEIEIIKQQINLQRKYAELIATGDFYRLKTSLSSTDAWMVVSRDGQQALVCYFKGLSHPNMGYDHVKLYGLNDEIRYSINDSYYLYGDELKNIGLPLEYSLNGDRIQDFDSKIFEIKAN